MVVLDTATALREATPAARPRTRLLALDGLRLVAALMVFFFHFAGKEDVEKFWGTSPGKLFPQLSQVATYGDLGVDLFFLISGFVISMSGWGRSPGRFAISRAVRLYPAYWLALGLVTALTLARPSIQKPPSAHDFLVNLTLLQVPLGAPRILGVDWTLWVEVKFYVLFALAVLWKGATRRRVLAFAWTWLLVGAFVGPFDVPVLQELAMPDYAPYFIGGMALFLVHRFGGTRGLWTLVVVSWLFAQRRTVVTNWNPSWRVFITPSPVMLLLVSTAFFVLVALVAVGATDRVRGHWLVVAGLLTYPFYLLHEHLGWHVMTLTRDHGIDARVVLVGALVGFLLVAYLVQRFVERPGSAALRGFLERWDEPLRRRDRAPTDD